MHVPEVAQMYWVGQTQSLAGIFPDSQSLSQLQPSQGSVHASPWGAKYRQPSQTTVEGPDEDYI